MLAPFIICQALLSVRDHGDSVQQSSGVTTAGALSPIMVVIGLIALILFIFVCRDKTAFEVY
jgi:hypothetical protein